MPETVPGTGERAAPPPAAEPAREAAAQTQPSADAGQAPRTSWLYYGLGLSLQTFLWFLLFLALVVAIAVGSELTEFRYVGF